MSIQRNTRRTTRAVIPQRAVTQAAAVNMARSNEGIFTFTCLKVTVISEEESRLRMLAAAWGKSAFCLVLDVAS